MMIPRDANNWFKSSRSSETADCVEVKASQTVGVRDTKDRPGGQLTVPAAAWSAFTDAVKTHR